MSREFAKTLRLLTHWPPQQGKVVEQAWPALSAYGPGFVVASAWNPVTERFGVLPEIIIADGETNGALFTNDEIRMKVRHWVSVFVADYRPLYKANVA